MEFKRPGNSSYPQVYKTFKVKAKDNDTEEEFVIQDLKENFFDDSVDMIVELHGKEAVFHHAARTLNDEKSIERVRAMYRSVFEQKLSLICLKVETQEIAGINCLGVVNRGFIKDDTSDDIRFKTRADAINFVHNQFSVMDYYKVDRFLTAAGLCVNPKFRGRGIATEILKARAPLMKAVGLEVTSSFFTTIGGQKSAKAAGYEENYVISFEVMQEKFPTLDFVKFFKTNCEVLSLKV